MSDKNKQQGFEWNSLHGKDGGNTSSDDNLRRLEEAKTLKEGTKQKE